MVKCYNPSFEKQLIPKSFSYWNVPQGVSWLFCCAMKWGMSVLEGVGCGENEVQRSPTRGTAIEPQQPSSAQEWVLFLFLCVLSAFHHFWWSEWKRISAERLLCYEYCIWCRFGYFWPNKEIWKLLLLSLPPTSNPETMSSVSENFSGSLLKIAVTSYIVILQCTSKS